MGVNNLTFFCFADMHRRFFSRFQTNYHGYIMEMGFNDVIFSLMKTSFHLH